jgi:hypothetical protein
MEALRKIGLVLVVVAAFSAVGTPEYEEEKILEKHISENRAKKEARPEFSIPILYDATVTQVNRHGEIRTRFYKRSEK